MITTLPGLQPTKPGSAGKPLPGIEAQVVDEERRGRRHRAGPARRCGGRGRGCCARSTRTTTASSRPTSTKFGRDVYFVGDAARKDEDGYFWIIGRVDDVINVSGHRLSTAEVESAIVSHEKVAEAAVIGQADEDTGQAITAFVTLAGRPRGRRRAWSQEIREHVAKRIGKLARPKRIIWADDLPKTRSGKIMRRLLRDIAEGRELGDVTTLRDPDVMAAARGQGQGAPERGGVTMARAPAELLRGGGRPARVGRPRALQHRRGRLRQAPAPTSSR